MKQESSSIGLDNYEGDIIDGVLVGQGTIYDKNRQIVYQGGFFKNQFDGLGILNNYEAGLVLPQQRA